MKCKSVQDDIAAKMFSLYDDADIDDALAIVLFGLAEFDRDLIIGLIPDADDKFLNCVEHVSGCKICAK